MRGVCKKALHSREGPGKDVGGSTIYITCLCSSPLVPSSGEREVIVVPVHEEVFAAARQLRVLAIPITQSGADVRYVAFYRKAPTSAITHFAPVLRIDRNVRYRDMFPSGTEMGKRGDMPLKVYHLGPMEVLERPVKKGWSAPIAGARYTDIEALRQGRYIDEVWPPETEAAKEKLRQRQRDHDERKRRAKSVDTSRASKGASQDRAVAKGGQAAEGEPKKKRHRGRRGGRGRKRKPAAEPELAPEKLVERTALEQTAVGKAHSGRASKVHYIVDGANVAMEARKMKEGGLLRQLELLVEKLALVPGSIVTVIVDAGLRHHIDRQKDLERMIERREVLQAPAQTQADEFILMTAEFLRKRGEKVRVVSNDTYSDYIKRYKPRFDWVHDVQEQFMFIFSPERDDVLDVMITIT